MMSLPELGNSEVMALAVKRGFSSLIQCCALRNEFRFN